MNNGAVQHDASAPHHFFLCIAGSLDYRSFLVSNRDGLETEQLMGESDIVCWYRKRAAATEHLKVKWRLNTPTRQEPRESRRRRISGLPDATFVATATSDLRRFCPARAIATKKSLSCWLCAPQGEALPPWPLARTSEVVGSSLCEYGP